MANMICCRQTLAWLSLRRFEGSRGTLPVSTSQLPGVSLRTRMPREAASHLEIRQTGRCQLEGPISPQHVQDWWRCEAMMLHAWLAKVAVRHVCVLIRLGGAPILICLSSASFVGQLSARLRRRARRSAFWFARCMGLWWTEAWLGNSDPTLAHSPGCQSAPFPEVSAAVHADALSC